MIRPPISNRNFMQICWVVPDVHAAIEAWARNCGVGPFLCVDAASFVGGRYRGQPASFPEITAALAYAGDMQIELVAQDNDQRPSIFHDVVPRGRSGVHHMALYCRDYDAERAEYVNAGAEVAFEIDVGGGRTCWVDTAPSLGFMVQLVEPSAPRLAFDARLRNAAETWDGKALTFSP